MINLCIINGSPRQGKSTSSYLISELIRLFNDDIKTKEYYITNLIKDKNLLNEILLSDKIIFVSPLYADCLPSTMLEFMSIFEKFIKEKNNIKIDMYCIVNCGFLEGNQNKIAINIYKNYSIRLNLNWRFGIGIGGGEFMKASRAMPLKSPIKKPVYNAFMALKEDIENNSNDNINNITTNAKIPKFVFKSAATAMWKSMAKKNNIKVADTYKRIY
ncbi:flavodoxin [Clostridium lacusfryxellense]|uniref:flavodoxin n=1 Tax=Clostridium lacusfryxellense TaxID=205328 RepID=UPI001C0B85B2|nr:flavodoxin [Clostridium lacusfryxellense]MBU3110239.1 flavodoxin [Clostridium lacusfryxellense]